MSDWIDTAARRLTAETGQEIGPPTQADIDLLLDLARVAAHDSGDRTNAPLAAYLVGLASGRESRRTLEELVRSVTGQSSPAPQP